MTDNLDEEKPEIYFNELLLYYRITYNHRTMLLNLKAEQTRLIAYFREKYHFE